VSSQDEAQGREMAASQREGAKEARARLEGGKAATALGGGGSDGAGRGRWAALDTAGETK
jgi:hypothetical protein